MGVVIAFLALFTTFVSVTTNYSRCYKIKDEVLLTIERNHGLNKDSIEAINSYLSSLGYSATGKCPDDGCWYRFSTSSSTAVNSSNKVNYCVQKHTVTERYRAGDEVYVTGPIGHPESAYYEAVIFFRLEWPILNTLFNIKISGETPIIFMLKDDAIEHANCK